MVELLIVALKPFPCQTQLVTFRGPADCLDGTTCGEVALAQDRQGDGKAGCEQLVQVFGAQEVEGFPLDVDDTRVGYNQIVVVHVLVEGKLFRSSHRHTRLLILRSISYHLQPSQVHPREYFLHRRTPLSLHSDII